MKPRNVVSNSSSNERWLVSYADYMTLMFALFVVLYSVAIVDEERYKAVSEVLQDMFSSDYLEDQTGIKGEGLLIQNTESTSNFYGNSLKEFKGSELVDSQVEDLKPEVSKVHLGAPLDVLTANFSASLTNLSHEKYVSVSNHGDWLEITVDSQILFVSGSATLVHAAQPILQKIRDLLSTNNNLVRVKGYTDNRKIHSELFSSNWALAAARATTIVEVMQVLGIRPERLAIEAYGEFSPLASNNTSEGRRKNRSVIFAVSKFQFVSPTSSAETASAIPKQEREQTELQSVDDAHINIITLPNGGIRITTRKPELDEKIQDKN